MIQTEDGYILELHRIPSTNSSSLLHPVILMHGNFQSSADWVINSPVNSSFAFTLHNQGYDVWMGNHRGNTYSHRHIQYFLNSNNFWNFSFHEIGLYDVPAMIDYVLKQTKETKLHYISFSYSTTAFFAGLSLRPEYNDKVASAIAMGPSVFQAHFVNGLVYWVSFVAKLINVFMYLFGAVPILPHFGAQLLRSFLPIFCHPTVDIFGVCYNFLHLFFGHDGNLIKREQLPLITAVSPSSGGLKAANHIIQMTKSKRFAQYDYGPSRNKELYGSSKSPDYNLTLVTAPVSIFVGRADFLASKNDAKTLAGILPNVVEFYEVPYTKWAHLDFTYGREVAAVQVYDHAIQLMGRF